MNEKSKYQITDQDYCAAYYGFRDFLEKQVGKEAIEAFDAINTAEIFRQSWQGKESLMDRRQKVAFTGVKKELSNTVDWLKAQGIVMGEERFTEKLIAAGLSPAKKEE
jgi:hypothetical protein